MMHVMGYPLTPEACARIGGRVEQALLDSDTWSPRGKVFPVLAPNHRIWTVRVTIEPPWIDPPPMPVDAPPEQDWVL